MVIEFLHFYISIFSWKRLHHNPSKSYVHYELVESSKVILSLTVNEILKHTKVQQVIILASKLI